MQALPSTNSPLGIPLLLFSHQRRQAYLATHNARWPSTWLPAMEETSNALLPHPNSGYSTAFASYIQFLRERHLVFYEPDIAAACVTTGEGEVRTSLSESTRFEHSVTYNFLALRLASHLVTADEYWSAPGFSLLDGMLYSSASLAVVEW